MTETTALAIDPLRLDFINIKPGDHSTAFFTVKNRGTGILNGTIETSHPWITTSVTAVNQKPGTGTVMVTVASGHLGPGKNDKGYIRISTDGGTQMLEVRLATSVHVWPPKEAEKGNARDTLWHLIPVVIIAIIALFVIVLLFFLLGFSFTCSE